MRVLSSVTLPAKDARPLRLIRGEASTLPDLPPPAATGIEEALPEETQRNATPQSSSAPDPAPLIQLGASVYDRRVSHVTWNHPLTRETCEALCGFDLVLLAGIGRFVHEGVTYDLLLVHTEIDTTNPRHSHDGIPDLSRVKPGDIVLIKGDPGDAAGLAPLAVLRDLLANENDRLVAYQAERRQFHEATAAWEKAHPKAPLDPTYWLRPHRGSRYLAQPAAIKSSR